MNDERPAPPVAPDVDLRGLPFMPLDTVRLIDSDLFALSTGDEFKAALCLWCKAWQQVPASSLPNDERVLAHLSGLGSKWAKVRAVALRGFVLCSDGRLYHMVIAEKAREAWQHREQFDERREHERERQRRHREERAKLFEQLREHGIVPAYDTPTTALRDMLTNAPVTRDITRTSASHHAPVTRDVTAKTGTVKGQGQVIRGKTKAREPASPFAPPDWVPAEAWAGYVEMRVRNRKPMTAKAMELATLKLEGLRRGGHEPGAVLDQSTRNSWTDLYPIKPEATPVAGAVASLTKAGRQTAVNLADWTPPIPKEAAA